jgi:hypothetical protein
MWIVLLIAVALFIVYKFGMKSREIVGRAESSGGMRTKYARLLERILEGHSESQIFVETRTYIRAGVSNYGGTTLFHIQQCPNNTVMIDYEIKNNPISPNFSLRFTFPDDMDQDKMIDTINDRIEQKMFEMMYL